MIEVCEAMSFVETEKFYVFYIFICPFIVVSKFDSQMAFSNFLIPQVSSRFHLPIKKNYIFFAADTNFKVVGPQTTLKSEKKKNNRAIAKILKFKPRI